MAKLPASSKKALQAKRLAEALKANLKRRKEQARQRADKPFDAAESDRKR